MLLEHPSVKNCAAVVYDKNLAAFVMPAAGAALDDLPDELTKLCKERLPSAAVPSVIVPLKEMPVTAHGKVDKPALTKKLDFDAKGDLSEIDELLMLHGFVERASCVTWAGKVGFEEDDEATWHDTPQRDAHPPQKFAFISLRTDLPLSEGKKLAALQAYCRMRLPPHAQPDKFIQLAEVPTLKNGKTRPKSFFDSLCRVRDMGTYDTMFHIEGDDSAETVQVFEVMGTVVATRKVPTQPVPETFYKAVARWASIVEKHAKIEANSGFVPPDPLKWW